MNKNKEWVKADWSNITTEVSNEFGCFVGISDIQKFLSYICSMIAKNTGEKYQDVMNAIKEKNKGFFEEIEKFFKEFDGFSKGSEEFKRLQNLLEIPLIA